MTKDIDFILSSANLLKTITKLKVSLFDIEQKHPNRKDLINSLKESIAELSEVFVTFKNLEAEVKGYSRRNYDLEFILVTKEAENIKLREQKEDLLRGL